MITLLSIGGISCTKKSEPESGKGETGLMKYAGYVGDHNKWDFFLKCWEKQTLDKLQEYGLSTNMEEKIFRKKSQMFIPAELKSISLREAYLGVSLPGSYKDFLLASNGWLQLRLDDEDGLIMPIEKIDYLSKLYPDVYLGLFSLEYNDRAVGDKDYSEDQEPTSFNSEDFSRAIVISEYVNNGFYMINLSANSPEAEPEIWFYSGGHPGVYKFVSFAHLMQYAYIKTILEPDQDIPFGAAYIEGTCSEALGFPKIKM